METEEKRQFGKKRKRREEKEVEKRQHAIKHKTNKYEKDNKVTVKRFGFRFSVFEVNIKDQIPLKEA